MKYFTMTVTRCLYNAFRDVRSSMNVIYLRYLPDAEKGGERDSVEIILTYILVSRLGDLLRIKPQTIEHCAYFLT